MLGIPGHLLQHVRRYTARPTPHQMTAHRASRQRWMARRGVQQPGLPAAPPGVLKGMQLRLGHMHVCIPVVCCDTSHTTHCPEKGELGRSGLLNKRLHACACAQAM